jgi:hypothetical protein
MKPHFIVFILLLACQQTDQGQKNCLTDSLSKYIIIQNHHTVAVDQRFAFDFLIKKERCTFTNNGTRNEDFFCFGEKVLAPGSGKIVEVRNDVIDNKAGEMPENPGNLVIIDHGNGEYSVLAHFKRGSVAVKPGDRVKSGQFLGLCGNSGHSSEPHIHYHLQNAPFMFSGEGLPAQFISYMADGKTIDRGEPVWGQRIQNK